MIGIDCFNVNEVSVKVRFGIKDLLEKIIMIIFVFSGDFNVFLKAFIYDLWFDNYLGALALVCIMDGSINIE